MSIGQHTKRVFRVFLVIAISALAALTCLEMSLLFGRAYFMEATTDLHLDINLAKEGGFLIIVISLTLLSYLLAILILPQAWHGHRVSLCSLALLAILYGVRWSVEKNLYEWLFLSVWLMIGLLFFIRHQLKGMTHGPQSES